MKVRVTITREDLAEAMGLNYLPTDELSIWRINKHIPGDHYETAVMPIPDSFEVDAEVITKDMPIISSLIAEIDKLKRQNGQMKQALGYYKAHEEGCARIAAVELKQATTGTEIASWSHYARSIAITALAECEKIAAIKEE